MQYKNTVEAIYIYLDEIQKIVSSIGAENQVHTIDIDLATDKIRHVYELMLHLKNELPVHANELNEVSHFSKEQDVMESLNVPSEPDHENVIEFNIGEEPEAEPRLKETKPVSPIKERIKEDIPEQTQAQIDSRVKSIGKKKFLSDTFEGQSRSLNEKLSNKSGHGKVTDKFSGNPISSISSAIGLNEKFEIIQNLFDGNSTDYEQTMQFLNRATNFNEAYEYMSVSLDWDMDDPQVQKILELIRRKLIVKKK